MHSALNWWCPVHYAVQVEVRKDGQVRRRYRAKGLTDKGPRDLVFFNEQEQRDMSVLEYFERQHEIKCAHLPPSWHPACCAFRCSCPAWTNAGSQILGQWYFCMSWLEFRSETLWGDSRMTYRATPRIMISKACIALQAWTGYSLWKSSRTVVLRSHGRSSLTPDPVLPRLRYPEVPCVNAGTPRKPVWLPPELLTIAKGQRRLKLDERQVGVSPAQTHQCTSRLINVHTLFRIAQSKE